MKDNIALIGFKCCGKTAIGKALAEKLGMQFLDLDDLIIEMHFNEKNEKLSCREIHQKYGAEYFRSLEAKAIEELPHKKGFVAALGGGAVAYSANIGTVKESCLVIYLEDDAESLLQRIKKHGIPAFLDPNDLGASMKTELERRKPLYEKHADLRVNCSGLKIPEITEKIVELLKGSGYNA